MFARSCTKFLPVAQNCTAVAQCNPCATALAPPSRLLPLLPHFNFHEKFTSHLPDLQWFLQGNAISSFIRTTYGSFSSADWMDDLLRLSTATAQGIALLDHLNARTSEQKRYKKRAKDAIWQVYTPAEAVGLVLEIEMPKKT